uniref:Beta-1,4-N-acetylgalactosaminyltransferase n=1 Tax=Sparus aurata TaxID=8175 RepID=A0A671VPF8_SPAAU
MQHNHRGVPSIILALSFLYLQFKGRANLHAFEDWCGTSTAALRKNGHFPLYPHTRTTVKKLAISPKWSNYGLRIFGYLHPHTNGEFVFAVSSEDNSEFWLSSDDSPLNVKLLAWVGKTGTEWAVPGEFGKYASQTSGSIMLSSQRRYFFEVLFVQDDKGTGHVEVAWKLLNQDFGFTIIDSKHISLFASESGLLPSDVSTIPQTAASHHHILSKQPGATADMLREDPRDTFYRGKRHLSVFLLLSCYFMSSPQVRYSYIYPNDYTRLTHMELDENCFYPEHPSDMKTRTETENLLAKEESVTSNLRSVFDGEEDFGFRRRKSVPEIWSGLRNNPLFPNTYTRKHLWEKEIEKNMPLQLDLEMSSPTAMRGKMRKKRSEEEEKNALPVVNWNDTFQVSYQDFQALRSHHVNFGCNLVGNVQLSSSETLPLVKAFMDRLEAKRPGLFRLGRVINVVKRVDEVRGSRYLLELEVIDASGKLLRLSHYIYNLNRSGRRRRRDTTVKELKPPPLLCNPVDFQWNPAATVHIIVPVKNQARWVQQLITEMERLFKETQDTNFNLIITDYSSSDMDVKKALEKSSLYDYLKLSGNFERSAGLQAGVDLIKEKHSIVFLCDLHLHFPSNIIDAIRTHCVEGYMVFAPVVMRLDCGAAPFDARGFWELDGFGLLGIYKSDLEAVGGMNTEKFKDTWGGEDVELIDRILEGGLEVERIHLRNFYHNFHSKRGMWVTLAQES